ncbi:AAA family ATPase [Acinetobacter baumannii]|uniref:AAA family ATPase n=1 Tax=Acinetobacter baumannii TaxID=470 RepID=UPI0021BF46CD|nr:ATP-binding protein [Acinetobacter baumannii]MCT9176576.1 ATP-binding protein [Acinetobacter baumannii]MDA5806522.1 ATP-binding protein [Acinetobacter baumannii]
MNLQINNLGVIQDLNISPKPLTIICGKNNSGKTYAMYSLWAILELGFNVDFIELEEYANLLRNNGEIDINLPSFFEENLYSMVDTVNNVIPKLLPRAFNTSIDFFKNSEVKIKIDLIEFLNHLQNDFNHESISTFRLLNTIYHPETGNLKIFFRTNETRKYPIFVFSDFLNNLFFKIIFSQLGSSAFLMPTERAGLNLFFNELKTQKKAIEEYMKNRHSKSSNIETDNLDDYFNTSYYSLPIEEYINFMSNSNIEYDQKNSFSEDIHKIFNLRNEVKFRKEKGKIFFKTEEGKELSLHLASSSIKTNVALWIYLANTAQKSNLLMIDEPELNLHPDAQRQMARLIVFLVNKGLKIAVSTHSDYFIKEINSLIMLSNEFERKDDILQKYGYTSFDSLDPSQVIAYHFDSGFAEEMLVDPKSGIEAKTFDDVTNSMNHAYMDIHWHLNESDFLD